MKPVIVELAIMNVQRRKRVAKIVPDHALFVADICKEPECKGHSMDEIKEAIRELCRQKRVIFHDTVNDIAFEIKDGIKAE